MQHAVLFCLRIQKKIDFHEDVGDALEDGGADWMRGSSGKAVDFLGVRSGQPAVRCGYAVGVRSAVLRNESNDGL